MHSLSTRRSTGHPSATQDSLPVGGQPLPGGINVPLEPNERFQACCYIPFPIPRLCLAHSQFVWELGHVTTRHERVCRGAATLNREHREVLMGLNLNVRVLRIAELGIDLLRRHGGEPGDFP